VFHHPIDVLYVTRLKRKKRKKDWSSQQIGKIVSSHYEKSHTGREQNITILHKHYCFGLINIINYYSNFYFMLCFGVVAATEGKKPKSTGK